MIFRTNELRPEPARGFGKGYPQDAAPVDNGVIRPSSPLYTNALTLSPRVGVPDGWPTPETVPNIHRNSGGGHRFVPEYNRRTSHDFQCKRSGHRSDRGKLERRHSRCAEGAVAGQ